MAYIDREKAIAYVEEQYRLFDNDESKQAIVEGCVEALKFTPTADVVEVVRCQDCAVPHNMWTGCPKLNGLIPPPNFFCKCGTRKDDSDDK